MLIDHKPVLIGPATSFNSVLGSFYFGPFYYYILALFAAINKSPLFLTISIPVFFVVLIMLFLSLKQFSLRIKIIYSLLILFSAYSLLHTRFLWNLNMGFLLSVILFFVFLKWEESIAKKWYVLISFGLISGAIFQIHYGTLFLYVIFLLYLVKGLKNKSLYLCGFIFSFVPFVIFDVRHNLLLVRTAIGVIQSSILNHPAMSSNILTTFGEIFEAYLFPNLIHNDLIKSVLLVSLLVTLGRFLYMNKKNKIYFSLFLMSIVFFTSYIFFRRAFTYYLATYMLIFYLVFALWLGEMSTRGTARLLSVVFFLFFFTIYNGLYYARQNFDPFTLNTQEYFARKIVAKSTTPYLSVLPHDDDKKGMAYILLSRYNIVSSIQQKKDHFTVCFNLKRCKISSKDQIIEHYNNAALIYKQIP